MGGYTSKCEKKLKSLHPNVYDLIALILALFLSSRTNRQA
jgi:hypothetical protein